MKLTKLFFNTKRENPSDADTISNILMIRSGMIRKLSAGIYEWLPLGLKVLKKVEQIIREEMNKIDGQELLLPLLLPKDLWLETGRWNLYGKELFRIKDRKNSEFCLGPTHEEVITDIVRKEVKSYRQLPLMLYQFGTKFRDEIRPRFGVIRAREFYMKDAYSFHATEEDAENYYRKVYDAYCKICDRCSFKYKVVEATTGTIGGKFSHEFMVLADTGEEEIVVCQNCGYAANIEKAECLIEPETTKEKMLNLEQVYTPDKKTVEEVGNFLNISLDKFIKTLIYIAEYENKTEPFVVLINGKYEVNETKLKNYLNCNEIKLATPEIIFEITGAPVGFAGPVGLSSIKILSDYSVVNLVNAVSGANKKDYHMKNININRDYKPDEILDLRKIQKNDLCPKCKTRNLTIIHGIEVGHTFKLGTKYSKSLSAFFLDVNGEKQYFIMGCYGIGVSRIVAAVIEQSHDENGIIWPVNLAPYKVIVLPVDYNDPKIKQVSDEIYNKLLELNIDVLLDDRNERPGVKFKDSDLIGIPIRITVSNKTLKENKVEIKMRNTNEIKLIDYKNLFSEILTYGVA